MNLFFSIPPSSPLLDLELSQVDEFDDYDDFYNNDDHGLEYDENNSIHFHSFAFRTYRASASTPRTQPAHRQRLMMMMMITVMMIVMMMMMMMITLVTMMMIKTQLAQMLSNIL